MNTVLKKIIRRTSLQFLSFWIILWWISYAAILWPSNAPNWENSWGTFETYFNKIFTSCPTGQVLQWYDKIIWKKCISLNCITPTSWVHSGLTYSLSSQNITHGNTVIIISSNRAFWNPPSHGNTSAKFTYSCNAGNISLISSENNSWSCSTSWYTFNNNYSSPECTSTSYTECKIWAIVSNKDIRNYLWKEYTMCWAGWEWADTAKTMHYPGNLVGHSIAILPWNTLKNAWAPRFTCNIEGTPTIVYRAWLRNYQDNRYLIWWASYSSAATQTAPHPYEHWMSWSPIDFSTQEQDFDVICWYGGPAYNYVPSDKWLWAILCCR